jgi:succinylarginine dihydrolase
MASAGKVIDDDPAGTHTSAGLPVPFDPERSRVLVLRKHRAMSGAVQLRGLLLHTASRQSKPPCSYVLSAHPMIVASAVVVEQDRGSRLTSGPRSSARVVRTAGFSGSDGRVSGASLTDGKSDWLARWRSAALPDRAVRPARTRPSSGPSNSAASTCSRVSIPSSTRAAGSPG